MPKSTAQARRSVPTTRRRLIAAAIELIAEGGWAAVTTRSVADRAGVNPGLVHYHLGSVHQLCLEATATALQTMIQDPAMKPDTSCALDDTLRQMAEYVQTFDPGEPSNRVVLEASAQAARDPEVAAVLRDALTGIRTRLTDLIGEGRGGDDLATALAAMLDGLALYRAIDPTIDIAAAADAVIGLLPPEAS